MNNFKHLIGCGLSIVPISDLKTKRPSCAWKRFQSERMTESEYDELFRNANGCAIVCGSVSGNLECIDVDTKYDVSGDLWSRLMSAIPNDIFSRLVIQKTQSGGFHLWYRTEFETNEGNQKLAMRPATDSEMEKYNQDATKTITNPNRLPSVLIETRAAGGYALIHPTPGYSLIQGEFNDIQTISNDERNQLIVICRSFDEIESEPVIPPAPKKSEITKDSTKPGDAFNASHSAFDILSDHGWTESHKEGNNLIRITRPGRSHGSKSGVHNSYMVYIHSTSTPFPTEKWLSAWDVYTILNHDGDYSASAKELFKNGYGELATKPNSSSATTTNPDGKPKPETPSTYFQPLGFNKDETGSQRFWFYAFMCKSIISMTPSKMSKANLLQLAPLEWWALSFPKSTGFNTDAAIDFLITISNKKGYFDELKFRGRGAWMDHGRVIIHTGTNLIIDGQKRPLGVDDTEFIYELNRPLNLSVENPLSGNDAEKILSVIESLNWEREIDGPLLAGWIAIAPICGALKWRPHIWLTAGAGTGKTWVNKNILHRMTGECGLRMEGGTTEAGLRELIGNDALCVLFDEAEGENEREQNKMENILHLMRSASSSDSMIAKGTGNGAKVYRTRSMFAFCSIVPQTEHGADKRRVTVLRLGQKIDSDAFQELERFYNEFADSDYVGSFQARMIKLMPQILKSIDEFQRAITRKLGRRDMGDQLGAMLGGWYHIKYDAPVPAEIAAKIVDMISFDGEQGLETTPDEIRCLQHLTSIQLRVETESGIQTRTIGELIECVRDQIFQNDPVTCSIADKILKRHGIKVEPDASYNYENGSVYFSTSATFISANLRGTPWAKDYKSVLKRIDSADYVRQKRFGSALKTPAVSIPISNVLFD